MAVVAHTVRVLQLSIHLPWGAMPAIAKMAGFKELRQVAQAIMARTFAELAASSRVR
jgi:hypothetical protein